MPLSRLSRAAAFFALAAVLGGSTSSLADSSVISHGIFVGASSHDTSGGVSILQTSSGRVVVLESDFSLDGAPDPKLGFGKDGQYDPASKIAPLVNNRGLQVYGVPDSVDVGGYNEFYVWCEKYSVPLGIAALK